MMYLWETEMSSRPNTVSVDGVLVVRCFVVLLANHNWMTLSSP